MDKLMKIVKSIPRTQTIINRMEAWKPLFMLFSSLLCKNSPHDKKPKLNFFLPEKKENKNKVREKLEVNGLNSHPIFNSFMAQKKTKL